jgi:ribosomal protein S18 acetylase RimI-like enzyme
MENVVLQNVTVADVAALQSISVQTFSETFADGNNPDDLAKYLAEAFNISRLTEELNDGNSRFYFALVNAAIIGYLKINTGPAQTELKADDALEIERIYVLKAYHGRGVANILYNKAIDIARQNNCTYVWLGVWEENKRAISFYHKNGFAEFDRHIFMVGDDAQTDIMMKLLL